MGSVLPGYFRSPEGPEFEARVGRRQVGRDFADNWFFQAPDFDFFRNDVERMSGRRWQYTGGTDLVLVNAWLVEHGEPTIDWASTISGQITDETTAVRTLTLGESIERITRDLETEAENTAFGGQRRDRRAPTRRQHLGSRPNGKRARRYRCRSRRACAGCLTPGCAERPPCD